PINALEIFQEKNKSVNDLKVVKFYTSGSFLDPWELPYEIRDDLISKFDSMVEEIVVETRCEYVIKKHLDGLASIVNPSKVIVAIGQETTNDEINKRANNKGHTLRQFQRAVKLLKEYGFRTKGYILLKPIFVSEYLATADAIKTAKQMKEAGVDGISINPCYIGKGTLMDKLFKKGTYTPPWLWTVLDVTREIKQLMGQEIIVISDPVAAGKERGPRNCGACDDKIRDALKLFSGSQQLEYLDHLDCSCRPIYENSIMAECLSNGMGIFGYGNH
ncbi:MAG: TIGR01210 family radical SAM protein, partial [Methanobacteriota archaeon]